MEIVPMINTYTLPCKIKLVCENVPYVKSVSIGVWVKSGSAYEELKHHGMSHFIEHMLFKGTASKSAEDIAVAMDAVGGQMNAFTSRDCTCFYTKTLSSDTDTALDLLSDIIINPSLDEKDIETEKNVVKEEINMYEDSPDDLVLDLLYSECYKGNPLGRPILGTEESVSSFTRADISEYMKKMYCAENTVVSVVGSINESELPEKVQRYFEKIPNGETTADAEKPVFTNGKISVSKPIEQAHIAVCYPSYGFTEENMYAMSLVSNILGGGMSSRLFQNVREKLGLCYSVYAYQTCYKSTGNVTLYSGCAKENADKVLSMLMEETKKLKNFTNEEFMRAKKQFKGSFILSNEGISGRMSTYGKQLLLCGKIKEESEILSKIDKINSEDAYEAIKFLNNDFCAVSTVIPG